MTTKKRKISFGIYKNPEEIEKKVKEIISIIGHFPEYNELSRYAPSTLNKAITHIYPGGKSKLAERLGYDPAIIRIKGINRNIENGIIDVRNSKGRFLRIKKLMEKGFPGLSKIHSDLLVNYIHDKELGINCNKCNYERLCGLQGNLKVTFKRIEEIYHKNIIELSKLEMHDLFQRYVDGRMKTKTGRVFTLPGNQHKEILAFWNWYVVKNRREGKEIINNICEDLKRHRSNNQFVYFTFEQLKSILNEFTKDEQILLLFCFDSIVRSPKELSNIRVGDISFIDEDVYVNVREEISKTYGRKFNLVLCGDDLRRYLLRKKLQENSPLFPEYALNQRAVTDLNLKLKKIFIKSFGEGKSPGGQGYNETTLYAFRHSGACYLRSLGVPLDKLLHRGGWKNLERLNYYTKFIGMQGKISKEELNGNNDLSRIIQDQQKQISELTQAITKLSMRLSN